MHAKIRAILERELDKLDRLSEQAPAGLPLEDVQRLAALVRCLGAVFDVSNASAAASSAEPIQQISTIDLLHDVLAKSHSVQSNASEAPVQESPGGEIRPVDSNVDGAAD